MRKVMIRFAMLAAIMMAGAMSPAPAIAAHCNPCGQGYKCCGNCSTTCSGGACVSDCDDCCAV